MIELRGASLAAGSFRLDDLDLEVPPGAYAVLMGRTGCGKTTLLEALCGLQPLEAGTLRLGGRDVTDLGPAEREVGYVPQDGALFPTMTVLDHLAFGPRFRGWGKAEILARVYELASALEIEDLLWRRPRGLSGGERQRVALGRALASRPPVLLRKSLPHMHRLRSIAMYCFCSSWHRREQLWNARGDSNPSQPPPPPRVCARIRVAIETPAFTSAGMKLWKYCTPGNSAAGLHDATVASPR